MHLTLIMPAMNDAPNYLRTWQMEPLGIAIVAALTPPEVQIRFYDDRMEAIDFDAPTDLVGISVETYCAQRAFDIAAAFRKRGKTVVMGGFHPTLMPEDCREHADSIVCGNAEAVWVQLLRDFKQNTLQPVYHGGVAPTLEGVFPDRRIFAGKAYLPLTLIENSRGCIYNCEFCSIAAYYQSSCLYRPLADVLQEAREAANNMLFFVDDNIGSDKERAQALFQGLMPLKKHWFSQISITHLEDDSFVDLMAKSGCLGVLIGFESLSASALQTMGKSWNTGLEKYEVIVRKLTRHGILVYGTFMFGNAGDSKETFDQALDFAMRNNLFLAAFNHIMPFPGTRLYTKLAPTLRYTEWWKNGACTFAQVVFQPQNLSAEQLEHYCHVYKKRFYSLPSLLKRAWGLRAILCTRLPLLGKFFSYNLLSGKDAIRRRGFGIGKTSRQAGL